MDGGRIGVASDGGGDGGGVGGGDCSVGGGDVIISTSGELICYR